MTLTKYACGFYAVNRIHMPSQHGLYCVVCNEPMTKKEHTRALNKIRGK